MKLYCISYIVNDYEYEETDYYSSEELVNKLKELLDGDLEEFNLKLIEKEEK